MIEELGMNREQQFAMPNKLRTSETVDEVARLMISCTLLGSGDILSAENTYPKNASSAWL